MMKAIGGHFSSISDDGRSNKLPGNYTYESARSGLYAILVATGARRIHLPNYVCDAVVDAINAAGVEIKKYSIHENFCFEHVPDVSPDELILLVNYFGLASDSIDWQLAHVPRQLAIVDCAQAYFQHAYECLATIYSPRKFLPTADGGVVNTRQILEQQESRENSSIDRFAYLSNGTANEPELTRELYLRAEKDLGEISLRSMSRFTQEIARSVDVEFISHRRRSNFQSLADFFCSNAFNFDLVDQVPLCYPLMVQDGNRLRAALVEKRIFTPLYWPRIIPGNNFESTLLNSIFLPIDHRYDAEDMARMAKVVSDLI